MDDEKFTELQGRTRRFEMSITVVIMYAVLCYIVGFAALIISIGCGNIDGDNPDEFMPMVACCIFSPIVIPSLLVFVLPFYLANRAGMYIYEHKKEWKEQFVSSLQSNQENKDRK
jgi:hypothetical protein